MTISSGANSTIFDFQDNVHISNIPKGQITDVRQGTDNIGNATIIVKKHNGDQILFDYSQVTSPASANPQDLIQIILGYNA
jgi:hypothetical protein